MLEKCAGSGARAGRCIVQFAGLPRSYVAGFIFGRGRACLWIGSPAVQRLACKMLRDMWPDVAGYTYAETSRGLGVQIQVRGSVFRIPLATQERLNDQVQARVYLARRLYADAESARQNADQGIRQVPDAGTAPAVGL